MLEKEEVKHVAELARIDLPDAAVEEFQSDLSAILDFFEELSELNTDGIEPIGHITGREGEARVDIAHSADASVVAGIKKNFPEAQEGYLKVRSVL
jgi:aspartyl-tRNA(Asn)/glutamyl-tRNA(Gln) amidotransferase subunit C